MAAESATLEVQVPSTEFTKLTATIFEDKVSIPAWVDDLDSFRQWARSGEMPEHGWFSYLGNELWVDLSMERLFSHNQVKTEITTKLDSLVKRIESGYVVADRMLYTNVKAGLSTEPDLLFFTYESLSTGRVRIVDEEDDLELEGTPDMVLEIVSKTSVRKDTVRLRELYWKAGIPEYWLVDARGEVPQFQLLVHTKDGYVQEPGSKGWQWSRVFNHYFQVRRDTDRLGHPRFSLATSAIMSSGTD